MGIGTEMSMQARNMPLFSLSWLNTLAVGLCVKFLKENPHTVQVPCFRGSPFLLQALLFAFFPDVGGGGICFGADCQMWKSPGVGTQVLEIDLRLNFRFPARLLCRLTNCYSL